MRKAAEAWEKRKFTPAVLEELEEINAPRYLAVSMCGTGVLGSQAGWVDLERGHKTRTNMGQLR